MIFKGARKPNELGNNNFETVMPEGEKKLGVPLVKGGQNLPPMVGIGLTGLPNILAPPVPAPLLVYYSGSG